MALLWPLLDVMMPGLTHFMPSKEGKSAIKVANKDYELQFGEEDDGAIPMKFYLIGNLKFIFMMLGRSGFLGIYCLYCELKQTQWKKKHIELNSIYCGAGKWIIDVKLPFRGTAGRKCKISRRPKGVANLGLYSDSECDCATHSHSTWLVE
jgi:hypothetical protein